MSGGYSRSVTASVVGATAERRSRIEDGNVGGIAVQLDYEVGWKAVSHAVRVILSSYVDAGEKPPAEDIEQLRQEIADRKLRGESYSGLSATVRHVMAVDSLGRQMSWNRKQKPFLVHAGPAHRGECAVCSKWLQDVLVWRERDLRWCAGHGPEPLDFGVPAA